MSDKVKITHEQAEKIKEWHLHTGYLSILLKLHVNNELVSSDCLQSLTLDELARALYVGCEVVEEFKVGDLIIDKNDKYKTVIEITEIRTFNLFGYSYDEDGQEIGTCIRIEYARHATESEIAAEKERLMDNKLDTIWLNLSDEERDRLHDKLECGDY